MKEKLTGYALQKFWFNFVYHTPKIRPLHFAVFDYFCWRFNSTGWEKDIEFSSETLRSAIHLNSRNPLDKAISELEQFGVIKIVQKAKNQHASWIIEWGEIVYNNTQLKEASKIHDEIMSISNTMNLDQTEVNTEEKTEPALVPVKKDFTELLSYHSDPKFKEQFDKYLKVRVKKNKPIDIKNIVEKLLEYSKNDKDIGLQILEYSIDGDFYRLFPPTEKATNTPLPDEFIPKPKAKLKIENAK